MSNAEYYIDLALKLKEAVDTKDLGEDLNLEFYRLIDMLSEDVLSLEEKHKVSILAEDALSNVRDFPDKISGPTR